MRSRASHPSWTADPTATVGYLLNEVPSNLLLARSRPSIFLPSLMLVWGAISIGAKGVKDLGGLVALRVFLGLVEAGFL